VLLARDPLVNQLLAHAGASHMEPRHSIDGVDGKAEAVSVIANGKFQRRVDVALFLIAADMDVVLAGSALSKAVD